MLAIILMHRYVVQLSNDAYSLSIGVLFIAVILATVQMAHIRPASAASNYTWLLPLPPHSYRLKQKLKKSEMNVAFQVVPLVPCLLRFLGESSSLG